jgi:hypothetical protein
VLTTSISLYPRQNYDPARVVSRSSLFLVSPQPPSVVTSVEHQSTDILSFGMGTDAILLFRWSESETLSSSVLFFHRESLHLVRRRACGTPFDG